jgi:ADP-heptose:LPS heptosyltransferase
LQKIKKLKEIFFLYLRLFSYLIEYLSWLIFSFSKFKTRPPEQNKIAILSGGALGDIFSSLAVANTLKNQNPDKDLIFVIDDEHYQKIEDLFNYLGFKVIPRSDLNKIDCNSILLWGNALNLEDLSKKPFLIGNNYSSTKESLKTTFHYNNLFRINRKIPPFWRHKIDKEINISKLARLKITKNLIPVKALENHKVNKILKEKRIKKYVVIHPSGRNFAEIVRGKKIPNLAWPFERFSDIADELVKKYNLNVIITGDKQEKFIGEIIRTKCKEKNKLFNLSGEIDLFGLTSIIQKAEMVVSVDTSAVHIAEFTGTPVIALFGPTFVEEIGPYGKKEFNIALGHPNKCVRDRRKGAYPGERNLCMESITTEEVKICIENILKKKCHKS